MISPLHPPRRWPPLLSRRERGRDPETGRTMRPRFASTLLCEFFRFVSFRSGIGGMERSFSKNRSIPRAFLGENEVIEVAVINLRQGLSRFQHLASLLTQSRNRFLPIVRGKRENIIRTDERWREDIADPVISEILFFLQATKRVARVVQRNRKKMERKGGKRKERQRSVIIDADPGSLFPAD